MAILITGGGGFTGSRLIATFAARGEKVVAFDIGFEDSLIADHPENVVFVKGNIANYAEVLNVIKENDIKTVFHLAAMLTVPSEANPWASLNVNALGIYHVLEAARLFGVDRVMFTSSIGAYGVTQDTIVTHDTAQRPTNIYGISKVFGELLGMYYHTKFGIDFRGVRIPSVLGLGVKTPGVAQYNPLVIEAAIKGEPFEIWVTEDTVIPMMHIKDIVRSLIMLHDAPGEKLNARVYNLGQINPPPTAKDLVDTVKKHYPKAEITFKPDPAIMNILKNIPRIIRSDEAEAEWGWSLSYSLDDTVKDIIDEYQKQRPV